MKKEIILDLKEEPVEVFKSEDFLKLVEYANENQKQLDNYWLNESVEDIQFYLKYAASKLTYFEKYIEDDPKDFSVFRLGAFLGSIESYGNILYEKKKEQLAVDRVYKEGHTIKYLDDIVRLLENHGGLTHAELCRYLALKTSTLSEAIKKVRETGVINVHSSGKYKIYSLSDVGIRYGKYLRNLKRNKTSNEQLLKLIEQSASAASSISELEEFKKRILEILNIYGTISKNQKATLHIDGCIRNRPIIETKHVQIDSIENNANGKIDIYCKLDELNLSNDKTSLSFIPSIIRNTPQNVLLDA